MACVSRSQTVIDLIKSNTISKRKNQLSALTIVNNCRYRHTFPTNSCRPRKLILACVSCVSRAVYATTYL